MNILILGGNSPRHYDWIRQLGAYFSAQGHEVRLHDYAHWQTGESVADIDMELGRLKRELTDFKEYVSYTKVPLLPVCRVVGMAFLLQVNHYRFCNFLRLDGKGRAARHDRLAVISLPLQAGRVLGHRKERHR